MTTTKAVIFYLILAALAVFCVRYVALNSTGSGVYACYITEHEKKEVAKQIRKDKWITTIIVGYGVRPDLADKIVTTVMKATEGKHPKLSPELVLAVIAKESTFRPDVVSPGGHGLMQLTAASGHKVTTHIETNIRGGVSLLNDYLRKFPKDKAIAAYNIGEGTVRLGGYNEAYVLGVKKHLRKFQSV